MTRINTRRGIVLGVMTGLAALSFAVAGLVSGPHSGSEEVRQTPPGEVAAVLHMIGLDSESLAAAGVSGAQTDDVFNVANVYCLQTNRVTQFQNAARDLNQAQARAARPASGPAHGDGQGGTPPPTVAQAKDALDDLKTAGFNTVTSTLNATQKSKLTRIRANKTWGLPAAYLTVDRTDQQWLALRGALANKRYGESHGKAVSQQVASVISEAEANTTVATAKQDLGSNLTAVTQTWAAREQPTGAP